MMTWCDTAAPNQDGGQSCPTPPATSSLRLFRELRRRRSDLCARFSSALPVIHLLTWRHGQQATGTRDGQQSHGDRRLDPWLELADRRERWVGVASRSSSLRRVGSLAIGLGLNGGCPDHFSRLHTCECATAPPWLRGRDRVATRQSAHTNLRSLRWLHGDGERRQ